MMLALSANNFNSMTLEFLREELECGSFPATPVPSVAWYCMACFQPWSNVSGKEFDLHFAWRTHPKVVSHFAGVLRRGQSKSSLMAHMQLMILSSLIDHCHVKCM